MIKESKKTKWRNIASYALVIMVCFWWLPFSLVGRSPEGAISAKSTHQKEKSQEKIIKQLMAHVEDQYALHFGSVHIPLPVIIYKQNSGWYLFSSHHLEHHQSYQGFQIKKGMIKSLDGKKVYDFSVTKNVIAMLFSIILMLFIFIGLSIHMRKQKFTAYPKGFWTLLFSAICFVKNDIARKYIGKKHYERFTPYLLTLFFYILFNNLLGLLPEGANITGNPSLALSLGLLTLIVTLWNGSQSYWKHIFMPPNIPLAMYPVMVPVELISTILRPFILGIRLFANMLAGHLAILFIIGIIFLANSLKASMISIPLGVGMVLLKIFVSYLQAYIFTMLTAMSFGTAVREDVGH